jgi:hypothetical protein
MALHYRKRFPSKIEATEDAARWTGWADEEEQLKAKVRKVGEEWEVRIRLGVVGPFAQHLESDYFEEYEPEDE